MKKTLLICASLLALGACGGGGSSSDGSTGGGSTGGGALDFSNPVAVQPGQSLDELPEGVALSAPISAVTASITNTGTFGAFSGPQAGTVVASAQSGEDGPAAFRYTVGGTTVQFDGDVEESENLNGAIITIVDGDGTLDIFVNDTDELEFVGYGGWGQFPADDSDPAVGTPIFFGTIGAPIASPTSGNATYTGKSVGIDNGGGTIRLTTSDMSVNTDFSTVTVTSSNTLTQDVGNDFDTVAVGDSSLDFTATGSVSSTGYTATAGGMNVNGAFFGPNAEETGGTFHGVSGAGTNYGGAFAAAQ